MEWGSKGGDHHYNIQLFYDYLILNSMNFIIKEKNPGLPVRDTVHFGICLRNKEITDFISYFPWYTDTGATLLKIYILLQLEKEVFNLRLVFLFQGGRETGVTSILLKSLKNVEAFSPREKKQWSFRIKAVSFAKWF